jgi:hypothetical protein
MFLQSKPPLPPSSLFCVEIGKPLFHPNLLCIYDSMFTASGFTNLCIQRDEASNETTAIFPLTNAMFLTEWDNFVASESLRRGLQAFSFTQASEI